jgi:hypothetical protein
LLVAGVQPALAESDNLSIFQGAIPEANPVAFQACLAEVNHSATTSGNQSESPDSIMVNSRCFTKHSNQEYCKKRTQYSIVLKDVCYYLSDHNPNTWLVQNYGSSGVGSPSANFQLNKDGAKFPSATGGSRGASTSDMAGLGSGGSAPAVQKAAEPSAPQSVEIARPPSDISYGAIPYAFKKSDYLAQAGLNVFHRVAFMGAWILNSNLTNGGGESNEKAAVRAEVLLVKSLDGQSKLYLDLKALSPGAAADYKAAPSYVNNNLYRNSALFDDKSNLAKVGYINPGIEQLIVEAGGIEANGLHPLRGKPTSYMVTHPVAVFVRYDVGIKVSYEIMEKMSLMIKNELKNAYTAYEAIDPRIVYGSVSITRGDTLRGDPNIIPHDASTNSYPSVSFDMGLNVVSLVNKVFNFSDPAVAKTSLVLGLTGSKGTRGSFPNDKNVQDDTIAFVSLAAPHSSYLGQFNFRAFSARFIRNPNANGMGRNTVVDGKVQPPLVQNVSSGFEASLVDIPNVICKNNDIYYSKSNLNNPGKNPDNEFTWKDVRRVDQWTIGFACKEPYNIKDVKWGIELSRQRPDKQAQIGTWSGCSSVDCQANRIINIFSELVW